VSDKRRLKDRALVCQVCKRRTMHKVEHDKVAGDLKYTCKECGNVK